MATSHNRRAPIMRCRHTFVQSLARNCRLNGCRRLVRHLACLQVFLIALGNIIMYAGRQLIRAQVRFNCAAFCRRHVSCFLRRRIHLAVSSGYYKDVVGGSDRESSGRSQRKQYTVEMLQTLAFSSDRMRCAPLRSLATRKHRGKLVDPELHCMR